MSITSKTNQKEYVDLREAKGAALFVKGNVCMTEEVFFVQSETNPNLVYQVSGMGCECPDFQRRQKTCKHMFAIDFFFITNQETQ